MSEFTYRADMLTWIAAHGSNRLQLAVSTGSTDDILLTYRDERLQFESPGWRWVQSNKPEPLQEPSENQLSVLAAVQVSFPTAYLGSSLVGDLWPARVDGQWVSLQAVGTPATAFLARPIEDRIAVIARPFLWGFAWSTVSATP